MYLHFFHLKEEPFTMTPDPRFLFLSHQHEAAVESLLYGIRYRKGFMALTGEIGTGKTTLCRELLNRLDANVEIAVILNPLLSVPALLKAINRDFGNDVAGDAVETQIEGLNRFLLARLKEGHNAVVLIDEAQNLSIEALEMTRLLSNLETDQQKLLQIILVGQPELEQTLQSVKLRQLDQRISVRYQLGKLNVDETERYILHRLNIAGGNGYPQFEPRAFKRIYRATEGYPRLINMVCDRALLAAYARRSHTVNTTIVHEALGDLEGPRRRFRWPFWRW